MKNIISLNEWKELENILMRFRIGYSVKFDDHNGIAEMIIDTNTIAVNRSSAPKIDEAKIAGMPGVEEGI